MSLSGHNFCTYTLGSILAFIFSFSSPHFHSPTLIFSLLLMFYLLLSCLSVLCPLCPPLLSIPDYLPCCQLYHPLIGLCYCLSQSVILFLYSLCDSPLDLFQCLFPLLTPSLSSSSSLFLSLSSSSSSSFPTSLSIFLSISIFNVYQLRSKIKYLKPEKKFFSLVSCLPHLFL